MPEGAEVVEYCEYNVKFELDGSLGNSLTIAKHNVTLAPLPLPAKMAVAAPGAAVPPPPPVAKRGRGRPPGKFGTYKKSTPEQRAAAKAARLAGIKSPKVPKSSLLSAASTPGAILGSIGSAGALGTPGMGAANGGYGTPEERAAAENAALLASKTCRCGSRDHMRTTHSECPLNPKRGGEDGVAELVAAGTTALGVAGPNGVGGGVVAGAPPPAPPGGPPAAVAIAQHGVAIAQHGVPASGLPVAAPVFAANILAQAGAAGFAAAAAANAFNTFAAANPQIHHG